MESVLHETEISFFFNEKVTWSQRKKYHAVRIITAKVETCQKIIFLIHYVSFSQILLYYDYKGLVYLITHNFHKLIFLLFLRVLIFVVPS